MLKTTRKQNYKDISLDKHLMTRIRRVRTMAEYIDREALEKAMTIAAANGNDKGGMTNAADRC